MKQCVVNVKIWNNLFSISKTEIHVRGRRNTLFVFKVSLNQIILTISLNQIVLNVKQFVVTVNI